MKRLLLSLGITVILGMPSFAHATSWFHDTDGVGGYALDVLGSVMMVAGSSGNGAMSYDFGVTWEPMDLSGTIYGLRIMDDFVTMYGVGPGGRIMKTVDGGSSWNPVTSSGTTADLYDVSYYGANLYAVGTSGTIVKSGNGNSWGVNASGVTTTLYGISQASGDFWAVGASGTVIHRSSSTGIWSSVDMSTTKHLRDVDVLDPGTGTSTIWIVGDDHTVKRSSDGGASWTPITITGVSATADPYAVRMYSTSVIAVTVGGTVYRTTNGGTTWAPMDMGSVTGSFMEIDNVGYAGYLAITSSGAYLYDGTTPSDVTGLTNADGTMTNDTTPELSWSAATDSYSALDYYIGHTYPDGSMDATTTSGGATSYTWPVVLTDGSHAFQVKAYDESGNSSANWATLDITIDTTAPGVAMAATGSLTADEATTFLITTTDANGTFSCSQMVDAMPGGLGGGTMTQLDGDTWTLVLTLAAGIHNVVVTCYDNAGNFATTSVTDEWTVGTGDVAEDFVDDPADVVVDDPIVVDGGDEPVTDGDAVVDDSQTNDGADTESMIDEEASPGSLIKTTCDETVAVDVNDPCKAVYYYDMTTGNRHAFPNEKVYFTWYRDFDTVVEVSQSFMSSLMLGTNVTYHPGTRMVKFVTVNTVYAVGETGELRAIDSEETATALYGSTWNQQIDDISDAFFGNYSFGDGIEDEIEYDPEDTEASVELIDDIL